MFYWTRGNDSVKGLDTLRLAQYSVESYYTTVSEAVYETGRILQFPEFPLQVKTVLLFINKLCLFVCLHRSIPQAGAAFCTAQKRAVLHLGDVRSLHSAGGSLLGLLLDQPVLCPSQDLYWSVPDLLLHFTSL